MTFPPWRWSANFSGGLGGGSGLTAIASLLELGWEDILQREPVEEFYLNECVRKKKTGSYIEDLMRSCSGKTLSLFQRNRCIISF
jgi:hypothetical protein